MRPASVLEPTCGVGAFLRAARDAWPDARLRGRDLRPAYVDAARAVPGAEVEVGDFFATDWDAALADLPEPVLVLGNPPWVTSAALGALGSDNRPRLPMPELAGLDRVTGASNFDVSEAIVSRLLEALAGRDFALAMLLKVAVARRLAARHGIGGEVRRIDAGKWFEASVDAALVTLHPGAAGWRVFDRFDDPEPARVWGRVDGQLTADAEAFRRTRHLAGEPRVAWRSGIKHDRARVMELSFEDAAALEPDLVFPLLKGSDLARDRAPRRMVLVPQRALGEDTAWIEAALPRTWAHLSRHRAALDARKSRIYRGQPPFAVFGVGPYAFAPFKVAVAALYDDLAFRLVEPVDGRPVMLDDTAYFLPFETRSEAERAHVALTSPEARAFYRARMFRGAKRPVTKRLLMQLDPARLSA